MIGRSFSELISSSPGSRLDDVGILLARAIGRVTESEGKRANGETFPLELSVVPYEADTGRQFEAYIIDISDRRDSDRLKEEFVSVVSHELRTPLTSIRAALQLVLEEKPAYQDPDHEPLLDIALKNCERLILSINDILDVRSRMRPDASELSSCDLAPLSARLYVSWSRRRDRRSHSPLISNPGFPSSAATSNGSCRCRSTCCRTP